MTNEAGEIIQIHSLNCLSDQMLIVRSFIFLFWSDNNSFQWENALYTSI